MKFVCMGFTSDVIWENKTEAEQLQAMEECFAYDDELRRKGQFLGGEALQATQNAVTLRIQNGSVAVTDGPYAETKEYLGGILLLEARDMNHAIATMSQHPGVKYGPFEIRPADETINALIKERDNLVKKESVNSESAEAEIRKLIANWSKALEAKDVEGLTVDYASDAVLYDAIPPYKTQGVENIKQLWQNCLPYFPVQFKSEHRDLNIQVEGDLAFVHGLHHFVPTPADHPSGTTWMRITVCYRRIAGAWKVTHEHVSIPFNPMNNQAWMITDPAQLDSPDYGEVTTS